MSFPTLYGKDSKGELKVWSILVSDNKITVNFGKLGGKIQSKDTFCEPKNVGKANETTAHQQAMLEAEAKVVKQKKKGYFETKEEALNFVEFSPMKAHNFNDYSDRIEYPCFIQPKLNGVRCLVNSDLEAISKSGEPYKLPKHIVEDLNKIAFLFEEEFGDKFKITALDGEIYTKTVGELSLQRIISAFRKGNEYTQKLVYNIYDCVVVDKDNNSVNQFERTTAIMALKDLLENKLNVENIIITPTEVIVTSAQGNAIYDSYVAFGYEGGIYRNYKGMYEFGKRSYNLIKRKPRFDLEARVVDIETDKNNQGVLTCELENGVRFKCLMLVNADKDINYRLYDNAKNLINSFITVEYEEFSDSGVPTKPVGIRLREMNKHLEPKY